jgi:UDP-N-acetylglucosamine--N-acetylmuramyl-(pentapeptide) pyrophosphoryl-undecaprenol N-acetylglucosamine transferase
VLAVLRILEKHDSDLQICFVTDNRFGDRAESIMGDSGLQIDVTRIHAGKFRRYHRVPFWRQLADIPTFLRNIGDIFVTLLGLCQSLWLLWRLKPDVVFTKGGFVCVPLGMAARVWGIPLVIHDSDAHPGLANRILSKWAVAIATGSPVENYPYPRNKTHYVGIPVDQSFAPISDKKQMQLKADLGLHDLKKPLVVITGGGLGARTINRAVASIVLQLVDHAAIYHITGQATYNDVVANAPEHIDYHVVPFVSADMATVLGAADVVVSRVGATTMQELAALGKPVIMVPNPYLTGGHQLKNAQVYEDAHAAMVVDEVALEKNPLLLLRAIMALLNHPDQRKALGRALGQFARPNAAVEMADLIVAAAKSRAKH